MRVEAYPAMITFRIITVGKIKEKWIEEGCAHYRKMLLRYAQVEEIIVRQHKLSRAAKIRTALDQEADSILMHIKGRDPVIALDEHGELFDSAQFAARIKSYQVSGQSTLSFIIGSANGLAKCIKTRADLCLALSRMTYPHELAKLMLFEQLYRSLSILGGAKYHK